MQRAGVPTAGSETFSERRPALDYLDTAGRPYVVKADGLAGGKGVVVTPDLQKARAWVEDCFAGRFGTAGRTVVIEEHLEGDEISVFGLSDGRDVIGLEPARDYKRLMDGDVGPNTGGMGSFSPVAGHDGGWGRQVVDQMIKPVLACLTEGRYALCRVHLRRFDVDGCRAQGPGNSTAGLAIPRRRRSCRGWRVTCSASLLPASKAAPLPQRRCGPTWRP